MIILTIFQSEWRKPQIRQFLSLKSDYLTISQSDWREPQICQFRIPFLGPLGLADYVFLFLGNSRSVWGILFLGPLGLAVSVFVFILEFLLFVF